MSDAHREGGTKEHLINTTRKGASRRGHHTESKEGRGHIETEGREDAGRFLFANEWAE